MNADEKTMRFVAFSVALMAITIRSSKMPLAKRIVEARSLADAIMKEADSFKK
jgi:hypothetical protein